MAGIQHTYELTQQAEQDIEEIFDYTAHQFSLDQAVAYVSDFENSFYTLAANPKLGRERNELRQGLRSFVKNSHVIFYRVLNKGVRIVRVLHASRDLIIFLKPKE